MAVIGVQGVRGRGVSINMRRAARLTAAMLAVAGVSACGGFLPSGGPSTDGILDPNTAPTISYSVASLDFAAVQATQDVSQVAFNLDLREANTLSDVLGVGDTLSITVWENVDDGRFTAIGSKSAPISQVTVDESGAIFVPYAGRIRVAGRRIETVRQIITEAIKGEIVEPQVVVERVESNSRAVSVQGNVTTPGIYPISSFQNRLLPILATAGGVKEEPNSTKITLRRGSQVAEAWLEDLYSDPGANVALRSGDIIIVENSPRFYNAFGAVKQSGRRRLANRNVSLLDAITESSGLDEFSASATGVFVFRRENPDVLTKLNMIDGAAPENAASLASFEGSQPVVYQLRFDTAEAMFMAGEFKMRNGDTIYVTEAPYTQFRKVLSVIVPTLGTAGSVSSLAGGF